MVVFGGFSVTAIHHPMTRFDFRIEPTRKEMIEQAASLLGMSLTQFAKTALIDRAQEVVRQHTATVLSDRDRDIFLAALDADIKPNVAARRAIKRYRRLTNRV
jgi:uncharacterized protein (DUF1778 family)